MFSLIAAMGNSISSAAEGAPTEGGSGMLSSLIMIVLMVFVFYFLLIRPQKKRDKEAKEMMDALKTGDRVVTIGGIHGTVSTVTEKTVFIKVDDSTRIEFSKNAISQVKSKKDEAKENAAAEAEAAAKKQIEEKKAAKKAEKAEKAGKKAAKKADK